MKDILKTILAGILVLILVIGGIFGLGKIGNIFDKTIGKEYTSIQREKFKESKSYVEGMINDLSDYKREYDRTEDPEEKKQIVNYIDSHFSNFNADHIENQVLYKFLMDVRKGNL